MKRLLPFLNQWAGFDPTVGACGIFLALYLKQRGHPPGIHSRNTRP
jgi:hypothetical protein